jgi:hypothetical protein
LPKSSSGAERLGELAVVLREVDGVERREAGGRHDVHPPPRFWSLRSNEPKKKSRSRMMGPPALAPYR